jgi:hypothetical protein
MRNIFSSLLLNLFKLGGVLNIPVVPFLLFQRTAQPGIVGIAIAYGLDGPEIESRWVRDFPHCPDWPWGPPSLLYNGYRVFPGGKVRPGRDADPSPLSSAEVKNREELHLYSPPSAFVANDRVKHTYVPHNQTDTESQTCVLRYYT